MPPTTHTDIHGHEILHLVLDANPPLTRDQLVARAHQLFGADARYCTCSTQGMTLDELLTFLASRGKAFERGGVMVADVGQMCGSEDGHDHRH
jgi:probable metal-binding protein